MTFYVILTVLAVFLVVVIWRRTSRPVDKPACLDENVQFSAYRPGTIVPERWYPMLVFAHLSEPRSGQDAADPMEEVARQARESLAGQPVEYQKLTQDSTGAVPREGEITFVPSVPGVEFNPASRTFTWQEDVHREEFRIRAPESKDGETLRGGVSVFLGSLLLAEITLAIHVDRSQAGSVDVLSFEPTHARPYRKIFASYSHRDSAIVNQFEHYALAMGDRYLRDIASLRSGEVWDDRLARMIEEADVFQLFWSSNSMRSPFVKQEWQHALSLKRAEFVRPTYWEIPMPESAEEDLPPDELRHLHFQRIALEQPMDGGFGPGDHVRGNRSTRNRVGIFMAVMIPFLVPIAHMLYLTPFRQMRFMLGPSDHLKVSIFDNVLTAMKVVPAMASLFCIMTMGAVWFARISSDRFWAALVRRGRTFWFLATLAITLVFALPSLLRIGVGLEVDFILAYILPSLLVPVLSVWLVYGWMRWVFLPFLVKDRDKRPFTGDADDR